MQDQLDLFLKRLHALVRENRISVVRRQINRQSMMEHGLREQDVHSVLLGLTPRHYFRGPSADHAGYPGNIMEFKTPVNGVLFYIKVRIWSENSVDQGVTISFHEDYI